MFIIKTVDCSWTEWNNDGQVCSVTCGEGVITEQRSKIKGPKGCRGKRCRGNKIRTISCSMPDCSSKYILK